MRPDVVVVGGGVAGFAAAAALAESGARVRLLEARASCGGRARSWIDPATGHVEDNGQHVLVGGYAEFLAFVRRIGSVDRIVFEDRLELTLLEPGGGGSRFRPPALAPPLDLLAAALAMNGLPPSQVAAVAALALDAGRGGPAPGETTAARWLASHGQGPEARRLLWDPIVLATVNLDPRRACASLLGAVLRRALLAGPSAARVGTAPDGLGPLVAEPAARYLESRGGEVVTSSPVERLVVGDDGRIRAAVTRGGGRHEAGAFVVAAPPDPAARILPEGASAFDRAAARRLGASPIVAVHVWLDRVVLEASRVGLLDSPFHWAFDRGARDGGPDAGYVALVASAADGLVGRSPREIASVAVGELRRFLPAARPAAVRRVRVVKEREATPALGPEAVRLRPPIRTAIPNLMLAGDWVDTGLPATFESAAESGHRAARALADARRA